MMHRIRCLLLKEFAQIRRDRSLMGLLIVAPMIQLVVFGFAATTDIRHIALAVRDDDRTARSREYVRALASSGHFQTVVRAGPAAGDDDLLLSGRAGLVVGIPPGFGRTLEQGRPASVQVLVDGADSNFTVQGLNYLQKATRLFANGLVRLWQVDLARRGVALPAVRVEARAWYNPELISRYYMVPAVMGVLLLVTTMIATSMALVKEREDGTMEQLIVTPLRPHELIVGKLLPFVLIGLVEITLVLAVTQVVFRVPLRGSIPLLYGLSGLFLLTTLGLGLFVSTLVRTQQQAMLVAGFFVMMPFVLLSGFIFPVENMPPAVRWLSALIPLRYYLAIVRGIFLKGAGFADLWPNALCLLGWGLGILTLATLKFRKRLD